MTPKDASGAPKKSPLRFVVWAGAVCLLLFGAIAAAASSAVGPEHSTIRVGFLILGVLAPALAGILGSWIISVEVTKRDAYADIANQLQSVSRGLAQVQIRILDAIENAQLGAYQSQETVLALVSQAATMLHSQIVEVQAIQGSPFEGRDIAETKKAIEELAKQLTTKSSSINATSTSTDHDSRRQLLSVMQTLSSYIQIQSEVYCPYCGSKTTVEIGVEGGATKATRCTKCLQRFNAHRRGDGSVFSKPMGGQFNGRSLPLLTLECPSCHASITIKETAEARDKPVVCVSCHTRLMVHLPEGTVIGHARLTVVEGEMVGRNGPMPQIRCPEDQFVLNGILRNSKGERFAYCRYHDLLVTVTPEQYWHYLDEHDPAYAQHRREYERAQNMNSDSPSPQARESLP